MNTGTKAPSARTEIDSADHTDNEPVEAVCGIDNKTQAFFDAAADCCPPPTLDEPSVSGSRP